MVSTAQCITCSVTIASKQFHLNFIYGYNKGTARRNLWSHLSSLHGSLSQYPWMLAGDFNVIALPSESSNYNGSQGITLDTREFQDSINQLVVFDHPFNGPLFIWSNHQGFHAKKLDRVLINDKWLIGFNHSTVEFLPPEDSDHCPVVVQMSQTFCAPPKPSRVFNFWTKHSNFLNTVAKSWNEPIMGSPMIILQKKLKRLKQSLKEFNKLHYADISIKVKKKKKRIGSYSAIKSEQSFRS